MTSKLKDRLLKAMKEGGFTQKSLAEKVGLGQTMISKLTSGKSSGSSKIVEIAKVLNVRAEWLSDGSGPMRETEQKPVFVYEALFPVDVYNEDDQETGLVLQVPEMVKSDACKAYQLKENSGCAEAPEGTYIVVDSSETPGNNDLVYAEIMGKRNVYRFVLGGSTNFLSVDDPRVPLESVTSEHVSVLGVVVFLLRRTKKR
ncbi:helix-turn-helix domain-containing protein [Klebsiella oxytoca]|uniref:LexA family transcriptional regulator n=1 Tax=Klebsiella oxytoca TaxID=571 RepID=UPI00255089D6|nr:LexA family transcriptional regulator [Klebsiella oxytoca]MEC5505806.1 helix-turn-helix domain-containing protein [Klebsiella oxytoca]